MPLVLKVRAGETLMVAGARLYFNTRSEVVLLDRAVVDRLDRNGNVVHRSAPDTGAEAGA